MASTTVTQGPPRSRKLRMPKFILAIPAWGWWLLFFVVPVVGAIIVLVIWGMFARRSASV